MKAARTRAVFESFRIAGAHRAEQSPDIIITKKYRMRITGGPNDHPI